MLFGAMKDVPCDLHAHPEASNQRVFLMTEVCQNMLVKSQK